MIDWIEIENISPPPRGRPLLVYCPDWEGAPSGYSVANWNGASFAAGAFVGGTRRTNINKHVKKWAMFSLVENENEKEKKKC